jgi:hypothetical protein
MYLSTPEEGGETVFPFADLKVKSRNNNPISNLTSLQLTVVIDDAKGKTVFP